MIFASPRIYTCPDINVTKDTDDELVFTTFTEYNGVKDLGSLDTLGILGFNEHTDVKVESHTTTKIEYNEDHKITSYTMQLTEYIEYTRVNRLNRIYYSSIKIVENVYDRNSFETTVFTASIIEPSSDIEDSHYQFTEDDFTYVKTYTTTENPTSFDEIDADYYILQENSNSVDDELVGLGLSWGNIFYNLTDSLYSFSMAEFSNWTQNEGTFARIESSDRVNSLGSHTNHHSLGYEKQEDGHYTLMVKEEQSPQDYTFDLSNSRSFGSITFQEDGNDCYYVMNGIYYMFVETEYGYKVIDRRNQQYSLFSSIDNQMEEKELSIMNDQFLDLHNYFESIINYKYYVPQIIINDVNPFYLDKIK